MTIRAAFAAVVPVVCLTIPELMADSRPPCVQAREYAAARGQDLPATFDALVAFPGEYRREIYDRLPASARSDLWRTQLRRALDRPLTPTQQQLVIAVSAAATPDVFAGRRSGELVALAARVKREIPRDLARAIFFELGPPQGRLNSDTALIHLRGKMTALVRTWAFPKCTCNENDDCMPLPTSPTQFCCKGDPLYTCIRRQCGFLWLEECDGLCAPLCVEP